MNKFRFPSLMAAAVPLFFFMASASATEAEKPAASSEAKAKIKRSSRSGLAIIPIVGAGIGAPRVTNSTAEMSAGQNSQIYNQPVFTAGILAELGRDLFTFQTGLLYIQEGLQKNEIIPRSGVLTSHQLTARIDYLGVPLLAKINAPTDRPTSRFTLKGGLIPVIALGLNSLEESQATTFEGSNLQQQTYAGRAGLRDVNVIGQVGGGYEMRVARGRDVRFEATYSHSLLGVERDEVSSARVFTQSFLLSLAMGIDL